MNEKKKVKLAIDQDYFKIKGILSSVYYSENGSLLGVSEKIQNLFNNNELVNLLDRQNEFIQELYSDSIKLSLKQIEIDQLRKELYELKNIIQSINLEKSRQNIIDKDFEITKDSKNIGCIFQSNHDSTFTFKNNQNKETEFSIKELYDSVYEENTSLVDTKSSIKINPKEKNKFNLNKKRSENNYLHKKPKICAEIEVSSREFTEKNNKSSIKKIKNKICVDNNDIKKINISRSKSRENIIKKSGFSPRIHNIQSQSKEKYDQNNHDIKSLYKSQNSFASKSQTNFKTNRVTNIMKCNKLQSESRDLTRNNSSNRINIKSYDKNQTSKSQKKTFIKDKIINNNSNISKIKMKMKECNSQLKISGNQSSVVTQSINEYYKKSDKNYLNDKNNSKLDNNFNDIQFNRESDHISTSNLKEEFSFDKTNQTNSINDFLSGGESMIENNIFSPNRVTFYKKKRAGKMEITNNI